MTLTIAEFLRAVNPNIGLVVNPDGSYRIGVEDVNSDEILASLLASGVDLAAIEIIMTAINTALQAGGITQVQLAAILAAIGTNSVVVRGPGGLLNSGVLSADTAVKAAPGDVYWLTVSDSANLAIEINDSVAGAGADVWGIDLPAAGYGHFIFDPPIECAAGIYLDVSTITCKVTIGYI